MCLIIHRNQAKAPPHFIPFTTTRDYIVWKKMNRQRRKEYATSPFRDTKLRYTHQYVSPVRKRSKRSVHKGFHAFVKKSCTGWDWSSQINDADWMPCVIPAGAKVYYGDKGDLITDTIIVFKNIKQLNEHYGL